MEEFTERKRNEDDFDPRRQSSLVARTFAFFCCFLFLFWSSRFRAVSETQRTEQAIGAAQKVVGNDEQNTTLVNIALLEAEKNESEASKVALPKLVLSVDLNTATKAELTNLPGIGEALAERVVEYRESVGSFSEIDELLEVKGIGAKKLSALRPFCVVGKEENLEFND